MNSTWLRFVILYAVYLSLPLRRCAADEMEDFPLDADDEVKNKSAQSALDGESNVDEDSSAADNDKLDLSAVTSSDGQIRLFNQIMMLAMKKPSAKQKLAQVMPIIRAMSPSQRLTLATLVLKQMMSNGKSPSAASRQPHFDLMDKSDNRTAELMIPISLDIASIFNTVGKDGESGRSSVFGTYFYNPLSAGFRLSGPRSPPPPPPPIYNIRRYHLQNSRRKDDVPPEMMPPPYSTSNGSYANFNSDPLDGGENDAEASEEDENVAAINDTDKSGTEDVPSTAAEDCVPYVNNLCLDVNLYPSKEIVNSIRSLEYRHVFRALVEDYARNATFHQPEMERRHGGDENENLHICSSKVKYARPKKAKSMHGKWRFVVNTERYSQTVRVETCLNVDKACSYLNDNVKSHCTQIYNYHRLLTWDEKTGLSLDLFKIPTCCSCQIQHVTPFATSKKYPQKPDVGLQDNVIVDESSLYHATVTKPKSKVKPNVPLSPKRDSFGRPRRPPTMLPIHQEGNDRIQHSPQPPVTNRYSPSDNSIRRASSKVHGPSNIFGKGTFVENSETESSTPTQRVNYNYHPIIDFFKPAQQQHQQLQQSQPQPLPLPEPQKVDRTGVIDDWLPITEGPRALPN